MINNKELIDPFSNRAKEQSLSKILTEKRIRKIRTIVWKQMVSRHENY